MLPSIIHWSELTLSLNQPRGFSEVNHQCSYTAHLQGVLFFMGRISPGGRLRLDYTCHRWYIGLILHEIPVLPYPKWTSEQLQYMLLMVNLSTVGRVLWEWVLLLFCFSAFLKQIQLLSIIGLNKPSASISAYLVREKSNRSFWRGGKNKLATPWVCGEIAEQLKSTQLLFPVCVSSFHQSAGHE